MLSKHQQKFPTDWLVDLLSLAVIITLFYMAWLGSYPLFTPDEGRYSEVAREMIAMHDYITPRVDGVAFLDKPILYYWLQAASIQLFGVTEWALRFFPALFGMLGCLITYLCGRCLFDRRTGLLSAILLATTPLYFGGAHYANLDLEVAVLITSTLAFFIMALQTNTSSRFAFLMAAYLSAALAFLTKGLIGIAFPAMIGGAWMILTRQWKLLFTIRLPLGIAIFLVMTLPWYILVQKANPEFLHFFFVTQQVTRFLSAANFNDVSPLWFYLPIVLAGFFPWTAFLLQALYQHIKNVWQDSAHHRAELYLLLWAGIVFIFFSIPHSKTVGYILPIFPALALLVGHYIANAWERTTRQSIYFSIATFVVIATFLSILILLAHQHNWLSLSPSFTPYLLAIAALFTLSSFGSLCLIRTHSLRPLYSLCALVSALFLLLVAFSASYLNQTTAKPLIVELQTILQPDDEVINYYKFYQDVPLYLGQRVTLVYNWNSPTIPYKDNWVRELWYGMPFQDTHDWLINDNEFWQRFQSNKRVFVFLNENYFPQFKREAKHYFIIGKYNDIILLSNKPTVLSMMNFKLTIMT